MFGVELLVSTTIELQKNYVDTEYTCATMGEIMCHLGTKMYNDTN